MKRIRQIMQKVKSGLTLDVWVLIGLLLAFAVIYSFISVSMHNKFMTFGLDLGYFDEAIWKISRGKFPYSGVGCIWLLEDHFQPILYLLAPLYWIWPNVRILLIFQSFIMVFAGLPLYLLAKKIIKNILFSFSVVAAYLLFIGTQFSILNEFHQVTMAPVFIALLYLALVIKKRWLFFLSVLMLLFTKEDLSILIVSIGIGLLFNKKLRSAGIYTILIGLFSFVFLIYIFMPKISFMGRYSHLDFGDIGNSPTDVIYNFLTNPFVFVNSMVTPTIKLKTIFQSLFTYSFLPLFSPLVYLVPLISDFVIRFIYNGPQVTKWALVNHHAAISAMLLAIATIYGLKQLVSLFHLNKKWIILSSLLLLATTLIADVIYHAPIHAIFKRQFYIQEQWMKDNIKILAKVPKNASVAAQNNLLPHLTHRDDIYRLPYGLNSQYIMVDLHDGPNKYAPLLYEEMKSLVDELIASGRYSVIDQQGQSILLRRNYKTDISQSKYYKDTRYCYYSFEER